MVKKFKTKFYEEKEFFEVKRIGRKRFHVAKRITGLSETLYYGGGIKNIVLKESLRNKISDKTYEKIKDLINVSRGIFESLKIHEFSLKYEKSIRKIENRFEKHFIKKQELLIVKLRNKTPQYRELSVAVKSLEELNLDELIKKFEKIVKDSKKCKVVELEKEKIPLIFTKRSAGIFSHEILGHIFEADLVVERKSILSRKDKGKKIFPELLSISDVSEIEEVDDEGEKNREIKLVENGVFLEFISDIYYSVFFSIGEKGRGRRSSYSYSPLPRQNTIKIKEGEIGLGDMISSLKKGILISNVRAGNLDVRKKEFILDVIEAYLIEDGKISAQVENFKMKGNLFYYLDRLVSLSREKNKGGLEGYCFKKGQNIRTAYDVPSFLFDNVKIEAYETIF